MDQELIEYLDRRFNQLSSDLRQDLGGELHQELTGLREELRTGIAASAAELRTEMVASTADLRTEMAANVIALKGEIAASAAETRSEIAASTAETRRHFDVVAEKLMDKIQLVGEGVIGVDRKVDRLAAETSASRPFPSRPSLP